MFDFRNLPNESEIYVFKLRIKIDKSALLGINWYNSA